MHFIDTLGGIYDLDSLPHKARSLIAEMYFAIASRRVERPWVFEEHYGCDLDKVQESLYRGEDLGTMRVVYNNLVTFLEKKRNERIMDKTDISDLFKDLSLC